MAFDHAEHREEKGHGGQKGDIRSAVADLIQEQSRDPYDAGFPDTLTKNGGSPKALAPEPEPAPKPEPAPRKSRWARRSAEPDEDFEPEFEEPELAAPAPKVEVAAAKRPEGPGRARLIARRFRPSGKQVGIVIVAALIWLYFWIFVGVMFLLTWTILGVWLALGNDRVQAIGEWWLNRKERKAPGTKARLRARAQRNVARIERALAFLPGAWRDGITLPDFSDTQLPQADPFERLEPAR